MNRSCLKTELLCPALWEGHYECMLPFLRRGDVIHVDVDLRTVGKINGVFEVQANVPMLTNKGASQRMKIAPLEDEP